MASDREPVDLDEYELIRINQEVEKIEVLVNQFCRVFRAEVVRILDVLCENEKGLKTWAR